MDGFCFNSPSNVSLKPSGLKSLCNYSDSEESEAELSINKDPQRVEFKSEPEDSTNKVSKEQDCPANLAQYSERNISYSASAKDIQNDPPADLLYIGLSDILGTSPPKATESFFSTPVTQILITPNTFIESHRTAPVLIASDSEPESDSSDSDSPDGQLLFTRDSLLLKPHEDEEELSSAESEDARNDASNTSNIILFFVDFQLI